MSEKRAKWEEAKVFERDGLAVTVMVLDLPRPKYSMVLGASYERDGQTRQGPRITVPIIKGAAQGPDVGVLTALIEEARLWIQERVDARPRPKRAKSEQRGPRRPKGPMLGLKELAKRDRAKWEAQQGSSEAGDG